jgi:hypothetical protein
MMRQRTQVSRRRARDAWRVPDLLSQTRATFLHWDGWWRILPSGLVGARRWRAAGEGTPAELPLRRRWGGHADPRGEDRVDCGGGGEKGGRSAGVDCWWRGVLALMAGRVWSSACGRTIAAAEQWCCGCLQYIHIE